MNSPARYPRMTVKGISINYLRFSNAYMTIWWGMAFPGFGQWFQGRYFYGLILIVWEFFINLQSNINVAICYTLAGRFDDARQAIDQRWFLCYIAVYIFAVWDCYHVGIDLNRRVMLAEREEQQQKSFSLSSLSIELLALRDSRLSVAWSLLVPGAGHFWLHRKLIAVFFMVIWILTIVQSRVPQGVLYTMVGDFTGATRVLKPEWLLFVPSLYLFACYDAYVSTERMNELYVRELNDYLARRWRAVPGRVAFRGGEEGL
ncbi:hypothetical protein [Gordoniibacillus kamchatkensis]|uniref:hypothetical protein n=1 Tax=Gordoniibacillus kamchatkensis TaxID=1590651 RepID=UPI0006976B5E|nr:hypothetical protein [Paenibacillus sp. VKM B-2647]